MGFVLGPPLDGEWYEGPVATLVEGWWSTRVTEPGMVLPDGAIDVMWAPNQVPWLAGPDTVPRQVTMQPGATIVGLRLHPGGGQALLGDGVDQAVNQRVPLDALWPLTSVEELGESLHAVDSAAEVAACLAAAIVTRVPNAWTPDPLVVQALTDLVADNPLDYWGLSERQFRRRFVSAIGYGPSFARRLVRFERFVAGLELPYNRTLAEIGSWAGYFDESHLSRDCLALTGLTPGQLRPR